MKQSKWLPYFLILPSIIIFLLFTIIPAIQMLRLSFFDWNMISPEMDFVGLENYTKLFSDPSFIQIIENTFIYAFQSVLLLLVIGIPLSIWISQKGRKYELTKSAIFSPHVIALVSVSMVWLWIMDTENGVLNYALSFFNIDKIPWLTSPDYALNSLVLVGVWKNLGYYTILLSSAVQALPSEVYEAAKLDNTPVWKTFFRITLPLLSPTIFFVVIISLIEFIQVFDSINVMTAGGPANSTTTLVYHLYQESFINFDVGGAAATGMILLIILITLNVVYFRLFGNKVHYN